MGNGHREISSSDFPNGELSFHGPNRRVVHSRGTLPGDRTRVHPALDRPFTPLAAARSDAGPNPEARQLSSGVAVFAIVAAEDSPR